MDAASLYTVKVLRRDSYPEKPCPGGVARTVFMDPLGSQMPTKELPDPPNRCRLRISSATVGDSDFSVYPGYENILFKLDGPEAVLTYYLSEEDLQNGTHCRRDRLTGPLPWTRFSRSLVTQCRLQGPGPMTDYNIIYNPKGVEIRGAGELRLSDSRIIPVPDGADFHFFHCVAGGLRVQLEGSDDSRTLEDRDTLLLENPSPGGPPRRAELNLIPDGPSVVLIGASVYLLN